MVDVFVKIIHTMHRIPIKEKVEMTSLNNKRDLYPYEYVRKSLRTQ